MPANSAQEQQPPGHSPPTQHAERDGPLDAIEALGEGLVKAAGAKPSTGGDPDVAVAFALGWQMTELDHLNPSSTTSTQGVGGRKKARVAILVKQVQADLAKLRPAVKRAGLDLDPEALTKPLRSNADTHEERRSGQTASAAEAAAPRPPAATDDRGDHAQTEAEPEAPDPDGLPTDELVLSLQRQALPPLIAADFRLGKAYRLARVLADTCIDPEAPSNAAGKFGDKRMGQVLVWLDELSSALPPHAAHSVASSVQKWRRAAVAYSQSGDDPTAKLSLDPPFLSGVVRG